MHTRKYVFSIQEISINKQEKVVGWDLRFIGKNIDTHKSMHIKTTNKHMHATHTHTTQAHARTQQAEGSVKLLRPSAQHPVAAPFAAF